MKKFLLRLIIIFLAIFAFSSCIEENISSIQNKHEDIFVVTTESFPKELNNEVFDVNSTSGLTYMLFDGLVKYDVNGTIIPSLSKSWEILNDGLKYRFTLKDNLYFSDGTKINSKTIKDFFLSLLHSNFVDDKYKNILNPIFGVKEFLQTGNESKIAINILDEKNIEFSLNNPCSYFLQLLSNPVFFLRDIDYCNNNWMKNYSKMVYSGPYKIKSVDDDEITLIKNENYDRKYSLNKKEIIYEKTISEHAMAMFDLNNVDAMLDIPKSELDRLDNDQYLNEINTEIVYTLNFNLRNEDVKNISTRREIIQAIENAKDGELIFDKLTYDSSISDINDTNTSEDNEINSLKSLNVLLKDTNDSNGFIELLKKLLKSQYNIDLNIKYFNDNKDLLNTNYQIAILEVSPEFLDEISILENWKSDSEENYFGFNDIKFDQSLNKAMISIDNVEEIKNCQDILKSNFVTTILGYENKTVCIKNINSNLFLDRMGVLRFDL